MFEIEIAFARHFSRSHSVLSFRWQLVLLAWFPNESLFHLPTLQSVSCNFAISPQFFLLILRLLPHNSVAAGLVVVQSTFLLFSDFLLSIRACYMCVSVFTLEKWGQQEKHIALKANRHETTNRNRNFMLCSFIFNSIKKGACVYVNACEQFPNKKENPFETIAQQKLDKGVHKAQSTVKRVLWISSEFALRITSNRIIVVKWKSATLYYLWR